MKLKAKVIAFYLPQFHPFEENNQWWGKGFTEWTSVGKAKKYFLGHQQPNVPADLGYYDLRLPEVRKEQADLAKEAGIAAFCYWHYWFGNDKQLMERPLQEVIKLGEPDFPFCLGWANHSWFNKSWNREKQTLIAKVLIEQQYPGKEDITNHFHRMLPAFKDKRYFKIHGKLMFLIYDLKGVPDFDLFKSTWNDLARENGLPGFYFIGNTEDVTDINKNVFQKCDAISLCRLYAPWNIERSGFSKHMRFFTRQVSRIFNYSLNVIDYKKAIKKIDDPVYSQEKIYPNIIPNWDNSPRRGAGAYIYNKSTPQLFKKHVKCTLKHLENKEEEDKVLFLKSWNEWAEGNYIEPDQRWGKQYIYALREALEGK